LVIFGHHIHYELQYDCLVGGPPGIFIEDDQLAVFVAVGQAPGHMSSFTGRLEDGVEGVRSPSSYTVVDDQFGLGLARSAGPALTGQALEAQISSFMGDCHNGSLGNAFGFATGPEDIPDEPHEAGKCSTIQHSPHRPAMP
jgi:hypothetical protein